MLAQTSRRDGLSPKCRNYREHEVLNNIYEEPAQNNVPITRQELNAAIASLNSKQSSVGLDILSNEMLKHLPENVLILLHFFLSKMLDRWSRAACMESVNSCCNSITRKTKI